MDFGLASDINEDLLSYAVSLLRWVRAPFMESRDPRQGGAPNQPLQPSHSAVTRLARASRAPAGGRLNGGVRLSLGTLCQ